eukprot:TRINITY_DN3527_c0_g1_i1.p1 TRINITY_DN3527_c0_g1~~TRINITY_DN3527_c0_g1_i1.p1  ORF type:complete len:496 (-),score=74.63 TRINITY_DN3527_c0_g1_i1:82-1416(-)
MRIPFQQNYVIIRGVEKPYRRYLYWKGESIFTWMAIRGSISLIQYFIETINFDIKCSNPSHQLSRALRKAWKNKNREMVRYLLSIGAEPNDLEGNNSIIVEAYLCGDIGLVEELLKCGARVDSPRGLHEHHITLLGAAIQNHDTCFVKRLIDKYGARHSFVKPTTSERGRALSGKYNNGYYHSALHLAVLLGYLDVVILLIERGCDVNALTRLNFKFNSPMDNTALHMAVGHCDLRMVKYLIANGASKSPKNSSRIRVIDIPTTQPIKRVLAGDWEKEDREKYVLTTIPPNQPFGSFCYAMQLYREYKSHPVDGLQVSIDEYDLEHWHFVVTISEKNHPLSGLRVHLEADMSYNVNKMTQTWIDIKTNFSLPKKAKWNVTDAHQSNISMQLRGLCDQLIEITKKIRKKKISGARNLISQFKCRLYLTKLLMRTFLRYSLEISSI